MDEVRAKINLQKRTLLIEIPLQRPRPSKASGKTLVVASTRGCVTTNAHLLGRPVVVVASAFVYPRKGDEEDQQEE